MKKTTKNISRIALFVCAAICAALFIAHFFPYWTPSQEAIDTVKSSYEGEKALDTSSVSVLEFMALPSNYPVMEEYLGTSDFMPKDEYKAINSLAGTFCAVFLLGAVSVVFIILKSDKLWVSAFPFAVGLIGTLGYIKEPLWKLGSFYPVFLGLSAALTVVSFVAVAMWIMHIVFWFMDPKRFEKK